ncbi:MAG: tetratricopeptide repeat protein [Spirochaetes bacterium]|nr:tetratricopeptide repeat protein [Spirochaetota bacterium]
MWVVLLVSLIVAVSYWAVIIYQGYVFPKKVKLIRDLIDEQKYTEARETLERLPASQRDDPMAKWLISQVHLAEGQFILAMVALQDVLKRRRYTLDLKEHQVHEALAVCYEKTGRLKESILELQFALHLKPDNFDALYTVGKLYYEQKNYTLCEQFLSRASKINPRNPHVFYMLGMIAIYQQDIKRAIDMFTACTIYDAGFHKAYLELGRLYFELKDYVRAQKNFSYAKMNPDCRKEASIHEGFALHNMHEYESAVSILKDALPLFSENDKQYLQTLEILSECYLQLRNLEEVRVIWDTILKINPSHPDTKAYMALFKNVFDNAKLAAFFSMPAEKFEFFVKRFLEDFDFFIENIEVKSDNEILASCQKNKMGQMKNSFIVLFNRTPHLIGVEELRELFIMIKNKRATQAYVLTPFDFHEECHQFITSRPVDLVSGERLVKALSGEDIF